MDSSSSRREPPAHGVAAPLVIRALALLAIIDVAVRVLPFSRLLAMARWLSGASPTRDGAPPAEFTAALERAGKLMPWARCVPRAIACHILVRRAGYPCAVIFGVARTGEQQLVAHAWPESAGCALIGPYAGDYTYARLMPLDLKEP